MCDSTQDIADRTGGLPVPVEFGVNVSASIACPPGTVVRQDRECAVLLPNGATLKFWVSAEIQWDDDDPVEISYNDMVAMGVYLEPDGGAVVQL